MTEESTSMADSPGPRPRRKRASRRKEDSDFARAVAAALRDVSGATGTPAGPEVSVVIASPVRKRKQPLLIFPLKRSGHPATRRNTGAPHRVLKVVVRTDEE